MQKKLSSAFVSSVYCTSDTMNKAFSYAQNKGTLRKGDYYEFGVYKGYSIWKAQKIACTYYLKSMRFFGFDSFKGLPETFGIDQTGEFQKGQFTATKQEVVHNIKQHKGDFETIHLIQGFYKDSLHKEVKRKFQMKKIVIAYIDCDLYSSTKEVLSFLRGLFMKNSLLLFDDWNAFSAKDDHGERRAFFEFQKKHPEIQFEKVFSFCWHGQAFRVVSVGKPLK